MSAVLDIDALVREAHDRALAEVEGALRVIARDALPRPLRGAVDRPRLLAALYRIRPAWRPEVAIGVDFGAPDLSLTICAVRADGSVSVIHSASTAAVVEGTDGEPA